MYDWKKKDNKANNDHRNTTQKTQDSATRISSKKRGRHKWKAWKGIQILRPRASKRNFARRNNTAFGPRGQTETSLKTDDLSCKYPHKMINKNKPSMLMLQRFTGSGLMYQLNPPLIGPAQTTTLLLLFLRLLVNHQHLMIIYCCIKFIIQYLQPNN